MTYAKLIENYDKTNKYKVSDLDTLKSILLDSPIDANLECIDIGNIYSLTGLFNGFYKRRPNSKIKMVLNWDTRHIRKFSNMFYFADLSGMSLDWVFIKENAVFYRMFLYAKYTNKLPKTEANLSFNDFVNVTKLNVFPELIENNFDISLEKWCSYRRNKILMKTNELYKPMLEYWLNTDFITIEEKIDAMKESGIEIFEI